MIDIIHIHSDEKFINGFRKFLNPLINNTTFLLTNKKNVQVDKNILVLNKNVQSFDRIIGQCKEADIVIIYGLDAEKSYIANRLKENVIIFWRFFGSELYRKLKNEVISDLTRRLFQKKWYITCLKNVVYQIKISKIKFIDGIHFEKEINSAIERCNYILCFSYEEYTYLKSRFSNIPSFLQIPLSAKIKEAKIKVDKKVKVGNQIIIGNSRNIYNNHLEILQTIKHLDANVRKQFNFKLFFSYGVNGVYAKKVKKEAQSIEEVEILEEFLPSTEFQTIYDNANALIINGYRQMALGNIFWAIRHGVKVYLNEKNTDYCWLKNNNIIVFKISQLKDDLENEDICLTLEQMNHNIKQLIKMANEYQIRDFHKAIINNIVRSLV